MQYHKMTLEPSWQWISWFRKSQWWKQLFLHGDGVEGYSEDLSLLDFFGWCQWGVGDNVSIKWWCRRLITWLAKFVHINQKQQNDAILVGLSMHTMNSLELRVTRCVLMRKQEIVIMN